MCGGQGGPGGAGRPCLAALPVPCLAGPEGLCAAPRRTAGTLVSMLVGAGSGVLWPRLARPWPPPSYPPPATPIITSPPTQAAAHTPHDPPTLGPHHRSSAPSPTAKMRCRWKRAHRSQAAHNALNCGIGPQLRRDLPTLQIFRAISSVSVVALFLSYAVPIALWCVPQLCTARAPPVPHAFRLRTLRSRAPWLGSLAPARAPRACRAA
jgi:hypothetical protein